jgi:hypothetical protein
MQESYRLFRQTDLVIPETCGPQYLQIELARVHQDAPRSRLSHHIPDLAITN